MRISWHEVTLLLVTGCSIPHLPPYVLSPKCCPPLSLSDLQVASVTPVTSVARSISTTAASRSTVTCMQSMVTRSFFYTICMTKKLLRLELGTFRNELSSSRCPVTVEASWQKKLLVAW